MFAIVCRQCHERLCEVDRVRAEDEVRLREHLALHREDVRMLPLGELLHHFSFTPMSPR
ncbi:MAG TPA: hypothetical protein VKU61_12480 [Candidatus Binatia bacterium]|nr:hypothetical protein [Candidatus Binatia bacterium]